MENKEVARVLAEIAELLELAGENPFKIRAYAQGARTIEAQDRAVSALIAGGDLARIKGIGSTLSQQIAQLVREGAIPLHQELKKTFPQGIRDMLRVPGLGPKKVKELIDQLGLRSLGELEYAGHENRLVTLPGFGKKSQENILRGIEHLKKFQGRFLFGPGPCLKKSKNTLKPSGRKLPGASGGARKSSRTSIWWRKAESRRP
jgi:DNA polymerase (family 10)